MDAAVAVVTFKVIEHWPPCDTAQTSIGDPSGTTWANEPTTPVGFSVAGINALLNLHELTVDHNGDPIITHPDTVIYNSGQITKAMQIFGSKLEPFTAENQDNAVGQRLSGVKQIVKRFVTSTTTYFLFDSKMNDAHFLLRRKADFKDEQDFDTGAAKFKTTTRFLIWFVDPRGWAGANAT